MRAKITSTCKCLPPLMGRVVSGLVVWGILALIAGPEARSQSSRPGWGATPYADENGQGTTFRTWAPNAASVNVAGVFNGWNTTSLPLIPEGTSGVWSRDVSGAVAGQTYKYVINGSIWKRDPYSRILMPSGTRNSVIHDPSAFDWGDHTFTMADPRELVIYEMHIGTFHASFGGNGTFLSAIDRLDHLTDLGINAIEVMPVNEFSTSTSWGYNPSYLHSVEANYGHPDDLKALIKACHERGIAVLMDVVHNHYGNDSTDWGMWRFDGSGNGSHGGIFFYESPGVCCTPWGPRPDYGREEVRQFIERSFRMWREEFRVDGFRWDAPKYILYTDGNQQTPIPDGWLMVGDILSMLNTEFPSTFNIAEDIANVPGFDAHWDMGYAGSLQNLMSQGQDADRNMNTLVSRIQGEAHRIVFTESHDTSGDLNNGVRFPTAVHPADPEGYWARKRSTLAAIVALTSPGIPMLWQGQEMLETRPFSDVRPVDWTRTNSFQSIKHLYRDLIHLRQNRHGVSGGLLGPTATMLHINHTDKILAYHRPLTNAPGQDVVVVLNVANTVQAGYPIPLPAPGRWYVHFNSDDPAYGSDYDGIGQSVVIADGDPAVALIDLGRYSGLVLSQSPAIRLDPGDPLLEDSPQGNGNGRMEPGELIRLFIPLSHQGSAPAEQIVSALFTTHPGVTFARSVVSYPDIAPLTTTTNTQPFAFLLSTNIACGAEIEWAHITTYGGFETITNLFHYRVGEGWIEPDTVATASLTCEIHAASLADSDGDGIPDWWEHFFFGGPTNAISGVDMDGDGYTVGEEYRMGTDPTDASSYLKMLAPAVPSPAPNIRWQSTGNRTYRILRADRLDEGFDHVLASDLEATPPVNTFVDEFADGPGPFLYRVVVD